MDSEAAREKLDSALAEFVEAYSGMKQRDASWYGTMGTTVGGSELAAIMGVNPYSSFVDVVLGKVATLRGTSTWSGGVACWWGVLFEDVIGEVVSIDLGSPIRGDSICIQEFPGHRNSPDGYVVATFVRDDDDTWRCWTTDQEPPPEKAAVHHQVLLLEFKCPLTRQPKGQVPPQYRPQVWSGLAVSPIAGRGLFVDAVFRKCGLADLDDGVEYDRAYHARDPAPEGDRCPVAWGLIAVYAPRLDAPRHVRLGWRGPEWAPGDPAGEGPDADASLAALEIHAKYFGARFRRGDGEPPDDVADLGDMPAKLFDRALGLIDGGRFRIWRETPCFADGRGKDLRDVGRAVEELRARAPAGHWLMGVLPWKLLETNYVFVARRPGFLEEVRGLIEDVHATARAALVARDPAAFVRARAVEKKLAAGHSPSAPRNHPDNVQELFDTV
ncbi:MAG: YqaJ viral recombinase family protein [Gemmatimonadaceae bacterium]|jgi:hypothetical protein